MQPINQAALRKEILAFQRELHLWRKTHPAHRGPKPKISDELGILLMRLAENLRLRPNFSGYTFDLAAQALPSLLRAAEIFDLSRGSSVFSYLTMTAWHAFTATIQQELRQRGRETIALTEVLHEKHLAAPETEQDPYHFGRALNRYELLAIRRALDSDTQIRFKGTFLQSACQKLGVSRGQLPEFVAQQRKRIQDA